MVNKFYFKFFLFCLILLLSALIIEHQRSGLKLPIYLKEEINSDDLYQQENEYLIYVSDLNDMIFPLNVKTKETNEFKMNYYDTIISNELDKLIYMRYSLLTNYSNYLPIGVKTYLPKSSRLESYELIDQLLILEVSEAFLNYDKENENKMLKILTYTFTSIPGISEIKLLCGNEEVSFGIQNKLTFTKADFILNVFLKTANINTSTQYNVYYYTEINESYYLVPTTIITSTNQLSNDENIIYWLTREINYPLITMIENSDVEEMMRSTMFKEDLPYYQYYLTCFENNIKDYDDTVDIKNVNYYEIEFD